jgi:hypothetical protein
MAAPCSTYLYYSIGDYRQAVVTPETDLYFYHPDHLGSASWITDARGDAIQHMQGTSDKYCGSLQPDSHDGCCTGWWDWNGDGREKIVLPQLNTIE